MASANVIQLTDATFATEVTSATTPVLVDFWATWCGPCRMLAPVIDDLAEEFKGRAKVCKMDTDQNREAASKLGIQALPTVILFKNGQPIKNFVGLRGKPEFQKAITDALAS